MRLHRILVGFILVIVALMLIGCVIVVLDGLCDNLHSVDLTVVLGNKVQEPRSVLERAGFLFRPTRGHRLWELLVP